MSDRKKLVIYLAVTFAITWGWFFLFFLRGMSWNAEDAGDTVNSLIGLGMLCPAIGALITRRVSGEGFAVTGRDSLMLGIYFRDKKWKYYLIAVLLPWVYFELGEGLYLLLNLHAFDADYTQTLGTDDLRLVWLRPLFCMVTGAIYSFAAYGEEAGWRGYMMPKMLKLWGVKKACLIGGIVWGIWHWPLTLMGHNFGKDYWGYPFTGMLYMCLLCIFIGMLLTYITVKSGSVWPAAIMHAVNNTNPGILIYFINYEKVTGVMAQSTVRMAVNFLPMMFFALIALRKMTKTEEKTPQKS